MQKLLFLPLGICLCYGLFSGCLSTNTAYNQIAPGIWRGALELEKFTIPVRDKDTVMLLYDQIKEGELPFNFEVTYTDPDHFYVEIINGSERVRCDSVEYCRNRYTARDTVNFYFSQYQSYLHADVRGAVMVGEWVVTTKDNYRIPFYAKAGQNHRFTTMSVPPTADISGDWATLFGINEAKQEKAIGEFKQTGNHLEGTFRTETGDYRYLEGTVQGRKFWMSCFDGSHAFLFSGSIQGDSLQGEFRSGTHYRTLWTSWRDPQFRLGNADSLTTLKTGAARISFTGKTCDGKDFVFPSPAFDGKVKIFTITGTWCPNCRDEQVFLTKFLAKNPDMAQKTTVVGFAFERHKDTAQANAQLRNYQNQMGIPFDLVYAGKANTEAAEKVFPGLSKVMAFPTMIVLDKQNRVRRIHTGFDGPATSKYVDFQQDFQQMMDGLTKE